jgi:hypothetical protein
MMAFSNNYIDTLILCVDGRYRIFIIAFDLGSHIQNHLIITGYIKTLRVCYGNSNIMQNITFIFTYVIFNPEVNSLTECFSSKIDYLRAMEKGCMQCGDNHQPDCPVGMATAKIHNTNDLLIEFYKRK